MYRLSKSKLVAALQCPKRLYLEVHQPAVARIGAALQARFDAGHRVGEAARALFPGGRLIEHQDNLTLALQETEEALTDAGDVVLFEATLRHGGILIRADVLIRHDRRLRVVEVKSSTRVHPYQVQDVAIQVWVIEGAGYPVDRVSILHLDPHFVYSGDGDYGVLFAETDVTQDIEPLKAQVPELMLRSQKLLVGTEPGIAVGRQCSEPFSCPFLAYCDRDQDTLEYPLSVFASNPRIRDQLKAAGYGDVRDVPYEQVESRKLQRIWRATTSGQPELDPAAKRIIEELELPRYHLDVGTIRLAVPIWAGTRPYEVLPFQWSCHVLDHDGQLDHRQFLEATGAPPMRAFADSLIGAMGTVGAIVVYSGGVLPLLRKLSDRYADLSAALDALAARLFALQSVATEYYYHRGMKGSWSIDRVLPTVAPELDFANLGEVCDANAAQSAFGKLCDPEFSLSRRAHLTDALRRYRRATFAGDGYTGTVPGAGE